MIKRKPNMIIKFTAEELATIKKIAETDCESVSCSECECAYTNVFRACFKAECEEIIKQVENNRRL